MNELIEMITSVKDGTTKLTLSMMLDVVVGLQARVGELERDRSRIQETLNVLARGGKAVDGSGRSDSGFSIG